MSIHKNYLLLTEDEKDFVDSLFQYAMRDAQVMLIPLDNSDPAERAVEAIATWVIESRPKLADKMHALADNIAKMANKTPSVRDLGDPAFTPPEQDVYDDFQFQKLGDNDYSVHGQTFRGVQFLHEVVKSESGDKFSFNQQEFLQFMFDVGQKGYTISEVK